MSPFIADVKRSVEKGLEQYDKICYSLKFNVSCLFEGDIS